MSRRRRRTRLLAGIFLGMGCTPAPPPAQTPVEVAEEALPSIGRATLVVITPPAPTGGFRGYTEAAGMVTVLVERGLADLEFVVPKVVGAPPAPGMQRALIEPRAWAARLTLGGNREVMEVELTLCDVADACVGQRATSTFDAPWLATAELLAWAAPILGTAPTPGTAERWNWPVSGDPYAVLVCGRSAATFYGLRPTVPPEVEGDNLRDPMARAVYIDPGMAEAHWLVGRRHAAWGRWGDAREAFTRAAMVAGPSPGPRADEAAALAAREKWSSASASWEALAALTPGDPRFLLPRAEAALREGDAAGAEMILLQAGEGLGEDADVLALRYDVAEARYPDEDHDALLVAWQETDEADPEPVRRRIANRVRAARYDEAWDLLPVLSARGSSDEAAELALGLGVAVEEWEGAATAADRLGRYDVATRIRARAALEADPAAVVVGLEGADAVSHVALGRAALAGGRLDEALKAADAALAERRWMPEALALRADVLDALGRGADAAKARADLRRADPAWG